MENSKTKDSDQAMKKTGDPVRLNDIGFRLILIPVFGILLPLVTGLIDHSRYSLWETKLSYLYTIGIAFVIWQGNRFLLFTLRSYFDWFDKPVRKITALILAISFYTIPVSVLLLTGWYHLFAKGNVNWNIVGMNAMVIMILVLFIVHVYETVFLVKEAETEKVQRAQTERAKAEAELQALKNQIDPHFIFNSLNTLSHLIEEKPQKAKLFNDNLAGVYRYILQNKARDLVLLREEMEFLENYFSLLRIRFDKAVRLQMAIPAAALDHCLVPPISLQVLAENAIKHNEFSEEKPLVLDIVLENGELVIRNDIKRKTAFRPSSRIGLQNLGERYKLTTSREIAISTEDNNFTVRLPVLTIG
ncbi:MAG: sensor histidine kinase [Chitinophagaceae bacterium]